MAKTHRQTHTVARPMRPAPPEEDGILMQLARAVALILLGAAMLAALTSVVAIEVVHRLVTAF
jgi:hypothetical protein